MHCEPRDKALAVQRRWRIALPALPLAACQTGPTGELAPIETAQGSEQNIASLTAVIARSPQRSRSLQRARLGLWPRRPIPRGAAGFRQGDRAQAELLPGLFEPGADLPLPRRPGEALADYNRAIQINPNYDAAYIGRGDLYRKAGRASEAFNDFQKAIQLDTTDGRAYHRRGLIYQSQGQHAFAIEDFSTAISLSPDAPEPYNGRGVSYLALNDKDNAFADFNKAIKLDGHIAESWANQALVYERRGDKAQAAKSYQQAKRLDPNYQPAIEGLARTRGA